MVKGPGSSARISVNAMRSPTFDSKRTKVVSVSSLHNGNGVQERTPVASPRSLIGELNGRVQAPHDRRTCHHGQAVPRALKVLFVLHFTTPLVHECRGHETICPLVRRKETRLSRRGGSYGVGWDDVRLHQPANTRFNHSRST